MEFILEATHIKSLLYRLSKNKTCEAQTKQGTYARKRALILQVSSRQIKKKTTHI